MNTEKTSNTPENSRIPKIVRRLGNTTYEVHVHFSETSKETMKDKMVRIISNDIRLADMQ